MIATVFFGAAYVGGTVLLTLGAYLLMRLVTGGDPEARDRDLAGSVIFRISALHGLILALVFAQEMVEYQQLKYESSVEANAVADVYFDSGRYDRAAAGPIQQALADYVRIVVEEEWPSLGETGRLSLAAWQAWEAAYAGVLDFTPGSPRQQSLREHMLHQIHLISESRVKRESHGADSINAMFWFAALSGVVLIALAYYPYPPLRRNLLLLSMFGAFTGIILFFIQAFSNPYAAPGALEPGAFKRLHGEIVRLTKGG